MTEDLDATPALEPPEGVESNFVDPPSTHNAQIIIGSICLGICVIAVTLRTFARTMILKKFDVNDAALIMSVAIMATYVSLTIYQGGYGQGRHQWNVPLSWFFNFLKLVNVLEILYGPLMFLAKYVVLRQIESIFLEHRHHSLSQKGIRVLIWGNLLFYLTFMISFICACIPREKIWNPSLPGRCIDNSASLLASSAINMVSDITILFLPLTTLWKLQLPLKSKFGVFAIFSIGIFANVASIVRFYYTLRLTESDDITYRVEPFAYWTHIEFTTVVIVACAPLLPLLIRHIFYGGKDQYSRKSSNMATPTGPSKISSKISSKITREEHSSVTNLRDHAGDGRDTELLDL